MHTRQPEAAGRPELMRDYELESVQLGTTTRIFMAEADPMGCVFYQFGRRSEMIQLPRGYAHATLGVIDMLRCAALIDPRTGRLIALATFLAPGTHVFLLGRGDWGRVFDHRNAEMLCTDVPAMLRRWKLPILTPEQRNELTLEMAVNIKLKESYPSATRDCFRNERMRHVLLISYLYPSGQYSGTRLEFREPVTGRTDDFVDLERFPFIWPPSPLDGSPPPLPDPQAQPEDAPRPRFNPRPWVRTRPTGQKTPQPVQPRPDESPPRRRIVLDTSILPVSDVIELLEEATSPEERWRIIEQNLKLMRPDRTYQILTRQCELISEHVRDWPPARLKAWFGFLPGSVLLPLMQGWHNNQVLALQENNTEPERILQWLREREVERLLGLDLSPELLTAEQARLVLRVDRFADPRSIRKVWRMLVGFLNADHGRSEERPIHRRKDEIVKHLQAARDLLLRLTAI